MDIGVPRLCAAALLLTNATVFATPSDDLARVLDDHWAWTLKQNPVLATGLGVRTYDAMLGEQSPESIARSTRDMQGFVARLEKIPAKELPAAGKLNRAILLRDLSTSVQGMVFGQKYMLFTNRGGWHSGFSALPYSMPFFTVADYRSYVARLGDYPRYNAEGIATTKLALKGNYTQYCQSMAGFEKTINAQVVDKVADSPFMRPFDKKPATISAADFDGLKARAELAITGSVIPAYREFYTFYTREVMPKCRQSPGVSSLRDGAAYYQFRIREQTTTDKTAAEIHALGLSEVARIVAEMDAVVAAAKFQGSRKDYVRYLRQDAKFAAPSPQALVDINAAFMKYVDGQMPKLFGKLPRLPYTVLAMQDDVAEGNTTAYYEPGAAEAGRAGVYRVNTTKLPERYLFEIPALGMHESVPGHHLQIALQQELDLPMFRRHTSFFTAFVEGWGLYSERLGIDIGVYDTPEKNFGRLSYEMWRACRLVVDTGLHTKGWSRGQAIEFMLENTALSRSNIEAEVDRYISWPGQALAYKIGELKIRELRTRAETKLGDTFDLRAFHDAVLENGAVPLDVLEAHIDSWIAARAKV
jgi:uncharacterized protein (DUF885 family)